MRPPRGVFMGFAEISGFYSGLARGFEELGVRATMVDLGNHPFDYSRPRPGALVRAVEALSRRRGSGGLASLALAPVVLLLRAALMVWALARHDVFIFGFGTSFFRLRELPLLRVLGKRVIFQFHGSDARPPYIDGAVARDASPASIAELAKRTAEMKRRFRRIDRYADHVVNNPTHGHFHERPMVVWLSVGLPTRPAEITESNAPSGGGVRVLHCPSDLKAKGTEHVRAAVERLREKGLAIDYVEVTGRPHSDVLAELARCDLVVDQLYADYGMPGFATEAAWFCKPVLIGGYATGFWNELLPPEEQPPTAYCEPEELEAELGRLVSDEAARRELAERARQFVTGRWSPRAVAERYLALASGEVPDGWLYDPAELTYTDGCGLEREHVAEIVGALVRTHGIAALELGDKPDLEARFRELAGSAPER